MKALLLFALVACAHAATARPPPAFFPGAPDWAQRGSGLFEQDGRREVWGVGLVRSNAGDPESLARVELRRTIEAVIEQVFRNCGCEPDRVEPAVLPRSPARRPEFQAAVERLTRQAQPVGRWSDGKVDLSAVRLDAGTLRRELLAQPVFSQVSQAVDRVLDDILEAK